MRYRALKRVKSFSICHSQLDWESRNQKLLEVMPKRGYVYLLASRRNGTLYVGVTSDLVKRVWQHKQDLQDGFTKRYGVHRLVYYEVYDDMRDAITREKRIKKWNRAWKLELIEGVNPSWQDLYDELSENPNVGLDSRSSRE